MAILRLYGCEVTNFFQMMGTSENNITVLAHEFYDELLLLNIPQLIPVLYHHYYDAFE